LRSLLLCRLSTIKKADKIVVLNKGKVVQEGTHESLLDDIDGVYYNLVHAQALSMGNENQEGGDDDVRTSTSSDALAEQTTHGSLKRRRSSIPGTGNVTGDPEYTERGLVRSYGLIIFEQRKYWILFGLTILAAMGCGGSCHPRFPFPFPVFRFPCSIIEGRILPLLSLVLVQTIAEWS
jgi:ATP-binding cassette, subfamily B (MDR/TAP), member 1